MFEGIKKDWAEIDAQVDAIYAAQDQFLELKLLYGIPDEPMKFKDLRRSYEDENIVDGMKSLLQKAKDLEPEIQEIIAFAEAKDNQDLIDSIRKHIWVNETKSVEYILGKLDFFMKETDKLLDKIMQLPDLKERVAQEAGLAESLRKSGHKAIWMDGPDNIKSHLKSYKTFWTEQYSTSKKAPFAQETKQLDSQEKEARQDNPEEIEKLLKNLDQQIKSEENKSAELKNKVSSALCALRWKNDRLIHLKKELHIPEEQKRRLLEEIKQYDEDISEFETPIELLKEIYDRTNKKSPVHQPINGINVPQIKEETKIVFSKKRILSYLKIQNTKQEKRLELIEKEQLNNEALIENLEHLRKRKKIFLPQLRAKLAKLKSSKTPKQLFQNEAQYPPLEDMPQWAEGNLKGRVIILKSAFKIVAKSQYQSPDLIYQSLELLANEYWEQKMLGSKPKEERDSIRKSFREALRNLTLEIGASFSSASSLSTKTIQDAYQVTHDGTKFLLSQHLTKGNGTDKRYYFRSYFAWDDENKQVIVGHMPDHLPI